MPNAIYIAGSGVISAIGSTLQENFQNLIASKTGVGSFRILPTQHATTLPAAEVQFTNEELAERAKLPATTSRTALLSSIAAHEAIKNSGLDLSKLRCAFISANTVGGMDKTENFFVDFLKDPQSGHLHQVVHHDCGAATEIVAKQLGIRHYVSTLSTACSSSVNSMMVGARLIRSGKIDVAVCGGADALCRFTLNGFKSLMILDEQPCKPYDENRKGLNLGEGAGYVVLVSEKIAATLSKPATVRVSGYANTNDAFHQTASSPEGKGNYLAMAGALAMANLQPADIDYINLHGTGTGNNDVSEGTAVMRLFGDRLPKLSSTKPYTGHTLAASGAIEAAYSILAIENGVVFPNLRFQTPMKELHFSPQQQLEYLPVHHVLSNSFGFGGNCSSIIFSKS
ncbi:MAG: beta-ketoacyl-[acyl-carrier-protein] synthase family protein [Chitinophagales bacterium]